MNNNTVKSTKRTITQRVGSKKWGKEWKERKEKAG